MSGDEIRIEVGEPVIYVPTVMDMLQSAFHGGGAVTFEEWFTDQEVSVGDLSDGFHTINDLYRHRIALFAALCRLRPDLSWRSRQHHAGPEGEPTPMFEGFFIAGMQLPLGRRIEQITYHCEDATWDWFEGVAELPNAPVWDGHSSEDVVERLNRFWRLNP